MAKRNPVSSRKHVFSHEYERLCILNNSVPLSHITANLQDDFIDCNADRVRLDDWSPILNALRVNNSLRYLAFRSSWQPQESGKYCYRYFKVFHIYCISIYSFIYCQTNRKAPYRSRLMTLLLHQMASKGWITFSKDISR